MMNTPVLIIAFNRPQFLAQLIERIRMAAPLCVYVAIDGPRDSRAGEAEKVAECRQLVASIDWPCEVKTLFQETNLGCGEGVNTAISWFFANEEEGIILEDDILPDLSFFGFCSELLDRYRLELAVFAISGCNLVPPLSITRSDLPYRFSQIPHIWGWATWKRSWQQHCMEIGDWREELPTQTLWDRTGRSLTGTLLWAGAFDMIRRKQVDTWDVQLVFASMKSGQLTATANVNLTKNIGVGPGATNAFMNASDPQPVQHMNFPMIDVPLAVDQRADEWTRIHHFHSAGRAQQAFTLKNSFFREVVKEVQQVARQESSLPTD